MDLKVAHYTRNMGGLNNSDSPFAVGPEQATGGYNYDYVKTGGFRKVNCPIKINTGADAQLVARGFNLYETKAGVKSLIRMAGTQFQLQDSGIGTVTALTEDTAAASSSVFGASGLAYSFMFTTPFTDVLWTASAGLSSLYGVYSTTKVTKNGADPATGSFSATVSATGGSWAGTGTYWYAIVLRKASTGALSNAALDVSAAVANASDKVTLDFTGLTGLDATKYDQILIYRSSVSGVSGFTAGSLVTTISTATTSYVDTGSSAASSQNVPRAGNTVLDNSVLPSGTYKTVAVWKNRLVTARNNTVYFSDINKPESWPTANTLIVPTGGAITCVAVIGYNHPGSGVTDEFLAVFKENETWLITGNDSSDWELKFIDFTGCVQQGLVANANGFLYWIDRRGVYVWDGVGKPVYASRPIELLFSNDGDIDREQLVSGTADFYRPLNQVIWCLSSGTVGDNKLLLKMDLRLTLPQLKNVLGEKIVDGIFTLGKITNKCTALKAVQAPIGAGQRDYFMMGDDAGNTYRGFEGTVGSGNDVDFAYDTAHLDQDTPTLAKRYHKVIAWVDKVGNWDLTLDYWSNYRVLDSEKSTVSASIPGGGNAALWDVGSWDEAFWNSTNPTLAPIVFNLSPAGVNNGTENNNEGDAIKLRFRNAGSGQPVTVNAFTIVYSHIGLRK